MRRRGTTENRAHSKTLALAVPTVVLVVQPNFVDPVNLPKLITLLAITLTAIVASLRYVKPKKFNLNRIQLSAAILIFLFLISSWFSGLLGSKNIIRSLLGSPGRLNGLLFYSSLALIVLMFIYFKVNAKELSYFNRCYFVTAGLLGMYMVLQYADLDPIPWNRDALIGTMGNENFSSAALSCLWVHIFYHLVNSMSDISNSRNFLIISVLAIMIFLIWKTNSLQGLVIISVGAALTFYSKYHRKLSKLKRSFIVIVSFVFVILLFVSFLGRGPLGSLLYQYTLKLRFYYSQIGIRAMIENPWLGVGPDSYLNSFKLYRDEDFVSQWSINLLTDNAHSVPIQVGSGFGVPTFLLYLILQVLILLQSMKMLTKKDATVELKAFSLVYILAFSQSLLSIDNIGLGVLQWVTGGLVLGYIKEEPTERAKKSTFSSRQVASSFPVATVVFASIFFSLHLMGKQDQAWKNIFALEYREGDSEWVRENFNKLGKITKYEPDKVERILPNLHNAGLDSEIDSLLAELVRKNPRDAKAFELLSKSQVVGGNIQSAISSLVSASKLDPLNYRIQLKIAELAKQIDDFTLANEMLKVVLAQAPIGSDEHRQAFELIKEIS